ncbi:unnamed protein product [Allacma fusca]|uniref:Caprin-1 dimerization domain-containing protein n=1 Tax=Allacma fusca TaxID=39272 RepID=A0A8J2NQS4_9HEXA|nr:unnamed protein product [Allacma fusca]
MPSASAKVEKVADFMDSFKQAIVVVEHKIRNLEKRKGKLDSYKQEQEQGKELNADQLAAVAKYNEVVQQLDFSRDLVKQLGQIGEETNRMYKKQQKKEQTERAVVETDRYRQLLLFQRVLDQILNNQRIRQDFVNGVQGTVKLSQDDLNSLDEFASLISPDRDSPEYLKQVDSAAEHIALLFQGKTKAVAGKNYKEIQTLLLSISSCEYFDPKNLVITAEEPQQPEPEPQVTIPPVAPVPVIDPVPAQIIHPQESTYNFMQESQIDIESPHMDPAVVSVSSFAPPPLPHTNKNEEEIDEWDQGGVPSATFNNSNAPAPDEANGRGDGANVFDRTVRGGFQNNFRGRGGGRRVTNGYRDHRSGPRGGNRGYQNGRGGYRGEPRERNDRTDRADAETDSNIFDPNNARNSRKRRGGGPGYNSNSTGNPSIPSHNIAYAAATTTFVAPAGHASGQPRPPRPVQSQQGRNASYVKH